MRAKWVMLLALPALAWAQDKTPLTISMPNTLTATPGSIVNVPITLALGGDSVAALGAAIKAANGLLAFSGFTPGPIIPGERFKVNAATPDSILLAYTDFGGGPLRKDGVLATLQFRISPAAASGAVAELNFSEVFATDPQFQNLPILPISGQVTVVIQPVVFSISDTLSGAPGDTIAVPVMLARNERRLDALGGAIKAGNRLLSYVRFVAGAIIPGPQLNVSAPAPDSVRLAYLNFGGGPIANDGVLATIYFRIDASAAPGDFSILSFHDLTASDSTFEKLPVQSFPGKVAVINSMSGSIQGMLWHDKNLDGEKNDDESPLEGWQINLTGPDTLSTNTGAAGNYRFENLAPGTYRVSEVLQPQWRQTFPVAPDTAYLIILASGQHVRDLNFANEPPVSAGKEKSFRLPENFVLFQNYPNPFWRGATSRSAGNPATTIKYGVPRQSRIKLEVINALGMRVAILTDAVHQPGYYEAKLDMSGLPGGIYFYRLSSPAGLVETRKLLLLK